ncbi:MAG TPA: class I SAM-dependent methyltransferase [Vicinamibacterales bacterium]|jgi:tRNA (cmo5U34)-methyltransferase
MGVARHLGIRLNEYDARIRTFIPDYEEMLTVAADAVSPRAKTIVDLGTGTGALAKRCLDVATRARVVGIDADADVLALAARRLSDRATLVAQSFLRADLPACDAAVASFALHHIRTTTAKRSLYRRLRKALRPGARFINVDCCPAIDRRIARRQHDAWYAHVRRSYSPRQSRALLAAWAKEDVYVPLETEMKLLSDAGFRCEVLWRRAAFAVVAASR